LTLVFSQIVLVLSSVYFIYLIADMELRSRLSAFLISCAFLFYPALGFLNSITGFHGVSAVIPFFLAAFYVFERMYREHNFSKKRVILFWVLLVLLMSGKEQIPLYVAMYGVYIFLYRNPLISKIKLTKEWFQEILRLPAIKLSLAMMLVGTLWFALAFFVIIPHYSSYRVAGYQKFADSLGISDSEARDVSLPNYFLSRYSAFGASYKDVLIGMILDNQKAIQVFFGGDKVENLKMTLNPVAYLPFASPGTFIIALPDFLINYLTSASGVGAGEIQNHRISMIIPVLFVSCIFAISYLSGLATLLFDKLLPRVRKQSNYKLYASVTLSAILLASNVYTSSLYKNPIYLWLFQSVHRRLIAMVPPVFASYVRTDSAAAKDQLKAGDIIKTSNLDAKDLNCATQIISTIPATASISGPDYLGAHLAQRQTYAIFPALYNSADYVIVDVFSTKITTILGINQDLISNAVTTLIKSPDYKMTWECGNLFVFKKVGPHKINTVLPIQEKFDYPETGMAYKILSSVAVVDYKLPTEAIRGQTTDAQIVYTKLDSGNLSGYVLFMSYINKATGEVYQTANLPSFAILKPDAWESGRYYVEDITVSPPMYLTPGAYRVFVGMTNNVKTRSIYLGDVSIK
jgi:uncharacterized membrane protein